MAIEIERYDADRRDRWDGLVERSPHGTPFHRFGFLETLADHAGAELHPLVGFKGQEAVGLFPLYEISKGPLSTAFSPPPNLKINYHGPALVNFEKLKQRKAERRHRRFVEGCLEYVEDEIDPRYTLVRTGPDYDDTRMFHWNEFDVTPLYSYEVDLTPGEDELLTRFSSDARQNVTREYDADVEIREGDRQDARRIIQQVKARHDAQDEPYQVTREFVADLHRALPSGTVRPYVCTVDGEFASGMVALEHEGALYRWQGGAKPDVDLPVNDLVDWHIMRDGIDRGLERYDLVGAFTPRLCRYKAKFAPELVTYRQCLKRGPAMAAVAELYRQLR